MGRMEGERGEAMRGREGHGCGTIYNQLLDPPVHCTTIHVSFVIVIIDD